MSCFTFANVGNERLANTAPALARAVVFKKLRREKYFIMNDIFKVYTRYGILYDNAMLLRGRL